MFGKILKLEVRGASHARAIRFALDGFPKGFAVDAAALAAFMERRAPGNAASFAAICRSRGRSRKSVGAVFT